MCLVAFQKIFRKIFSGVWKRRRKRQTQKNTDKTQIDARRSTGFNSAVLRELQSDDRAVDRDLAKHRATSRDRDRREGEVAISRSVDHDLAKHRATSRDRDRREGEIAISRSVDHDLAKHRADRNRHEIAIDGAGACERRRLELGRVNGADWVSVSLLRSRSLSLSLSTEFI